MGKRNYVAPGVLTNNRVQFETAVSGPSPKEHVLVDPSGDDTWVRTSGTWTFKDPSHDDYWIWE